MKKSNKHLKLICATNPALKKQKVYCALLLKQATDKKVILPKPENQNHPLVKHSKR